MIRSRRVVPACLIFALALIAGACVTPTNPGNRAPIAVIEASETSGPAPLTVEFSSAGSSDPDGTIASYQWSFGDGSEGSTLPAPTHTFTTSGTFTVTLTVTDNAGATGVATVEITVDPAVNQPPEAAFTASRTSGPAPLVVDFDASGSSDPDGDIATYEWEFGDGGTATGETASHTFMNEGSYVVQLTVTDDAGATASATETIVVSSNQPPTAAAAADPTSGKAPLVVNLSSAGSSDPEGGSLTYSWNFGDGSPLSSEANPTHTYAAGSYTATLTVTDPAGLSDTATVAIEAVENQPPVAVANATPSAGQVPVTINFSSAGSTDNDGTIVSYHWDFDDGTFSTQANPSHTYATVGTYTVTLTVTDDNGAAASATVTVEANPIPNVPPTAAASGSPLSGTHPLIVNFSSAGSSDSDGTIVAYDWDFGDGTSSTQANPSHTYTTAGTFTATLRVTDNAGGQATATVGPIEVAVNQPPTAAASGTPTSGKAPLTVVFSSAGTSDPENQTLSYAWDFGDGGSSTVANPSRTYTSPGTFTARLTVTDPAGNTDEATVVIAVAANQAPTAVVNAWPQSGPRALVVNFNGSSSSDPDGTIASYSWTFGDGGTSTAANPVHTYNSAGTFTATLTVTDDDGATDSESITITVYIDDDGDGFPLSDDCDDENPAIHPGAADPLDDAGIDQDCDGVDGVLDDTVFVATGGSDAATCTIPSDPCATISGGAQRAATLGRSVIQIANGTYGRFQALSGRTFRGGYAPGFTTRSGTTTVAGSLDGIHGYYGVRIVGTSAPTTVADMTINAGGASGAQSNGVIVAGSTANVALRNLNVTGGTGTNPSGVFLETSLSVSITGSTIQSGTATGAGSSAYGVRAVSSNVTITSSSVSASAGVAGAGSTATPATSPAGCNGNHGANASGPSSPGNGGASCGGSGVGTAGAGGRGGDYSSAGTNGTAGGGGAPGGVGGCGSLFGCGDPRPGGGGGGAPGSGGTSGSGGTNTTNNAGALWVGANGGVGGNGGTGGGGGGGGGGKSASASGGGGGGGGAGGTGGAGGSTPGAHGGGSFAVYAFNSHVNLIGVVATASSGGAGGRGSNGGAGGKGGNGGNGGGKSCCEASGGGGGGGAGGGGGGGGAGGGAGGPSIAVFHKGTGILSISGGQRNRAASAAAGGPGGTAGGGGARGEAGAAGNNPNVRSNPHPGTPGNPGTAGSNGGSGAAGLIYRVWDNGAFVN